MSDNQNTNGWNEWSRYVLKELERLNENIEELHKEVTKIRIDLGMLQVKAGAWGALGGLITGVGAVLIVLLTRIG